MCRGVTAGGAAGQHDGTGALGADPGLRHHPDRAPSAALAAPSFRRAAPSAVVRNALRVIPGASRSGDRGGSRIAGMSLAMCAVRLPAWVRAVAPALVALAFLLHHAAPPVAAQSAPHGGDMCAACDDGGAVEAMAAACLALVATALAATGLGSAVIRLVARSGHTGTRSPWTRSPEPPGRAPPMPPRLSSLCVLRR